MQRPRGSVDMLQLRAPKARATACSPLFRLPPEIRYEIYKLLLICPVDVIRVYKASLSHSKVEGITILLVCRLIHNEARILFYGSNTFRISAFSPPLFLDSRSTRSDTRYTRFELIRAISLDLVYRSAIYQIMERQIPKGRTTHELFELLPALECLKIRFSDKIVKNPDARPPYLKYGNMIIILRDNIRGLKKAIVSGLENETVTRDLETAMMQSRGFAGSKAS